MTTEDLGPRVVAVEAWERIRVPVYDGTGRPDQIMVGGPDVMTIQCTKCKRGPWSVREGIDEFVETRFHAAGMTVRICCETCQGTVSYPVTELPGYVETHS
jgi:hypothetical protein